MASLAAEGRGLKSAADLRCFFVFATTMTDHFGGGCRKGWELLR